MEDTPTMKALYALMGKLEGEFGYLEGDVPMHSVVNVALDLRGQNYFEAIRAMFNTVARYRGERENPIPQAYRVA